MVKLEETSFCFRQITKHKTKNAWNSLGIDDAQTHWEGANLHRNLPVNKGCVSNWINNEQIKAIDFKINEWIDMRDSEDKGSLKSDLP